MDSTSYMFCEVIYEMFHILNLICFVWKKLKRQGSGGYTGHTYFY